LRVDAESGTYEPLHRGRGLYFGIATDGTRYFVAARGRMVSSADPAEDERGCILVFDRAMRPLGELAAPFPIRDLHEILWGDGKLWVTCSFDNMIAVLDESSGRWESWFPFGPTPQPPYDVNHLNSLAFDAGDPVCRAQFRRERAAAVRSLRAGRCARERPSGSNRTTSAARARRARHVQLGRRHAGFLDGWCLEIGGFPRGIAIFEDEPTWASRNRRAPGSRPEHRKIMVFDPQWRPCARSCFPEKGCSSTSRELA
jgi:hypothetical protein